MERKRWKVAVLGVGLLAVLATGTGAAAAEERNSWEAAGLGVGAIFCNALYMPAKLLYATLGAMTGGLAYALTGGSHETADAIWVASLGGTYVITPSVLTGDAPLEFWGTPGEGSNQVVEDAPARNDRG
jgi:hypothetical protein